MRVWESGLVVLLLFGTELVRASSSSSSAIMCPINSLADSICRGFADSGSCPFNGEQSFRSVDAVGVKEGDEISLQRALNMVHKNSHDYVAVLFYASWCPFSGTFRPSFSMLSSLYPSIPHFAIEESVIRPSILSKYGVHGFPTLFLLNSTMRVRYHGSRTLGSLIAFYSDITGMKAALLNGTSLDNVGHSSNHETHEENEQESCPFSWARSPENLLRQETYLALATAFVILRLFYFILPAFCVCARFAWRRYIMNIRLRSLWEHPQAYLNRAIQLFNSLKEPSKRSNLQEGAMNAKAWASKSLATVSFGDASTSRVATGN
ncbi:5'-adenylylsulfate reductase-like 4 [Cornus florida]|uniref:5'-adenylylsulfate reductase-like 4 n=1 Tax=Cornus florida TaxID=4283 RepID=UPI00289DE090|nr:5'-adenylylsulfate reductase-like 4 [Cornus florida]